MMKIAVLITCHNRKDKTLACLSSLYSCIVHEDYSFEVFLVDDGSTDGTPEAVKKLYPSVNIVNGNGNLYWNRGMYKAWEAACKAKDYDFYLWLNDDTLLENDAIRNLLKTSKYFEDNTIIVGSTCSMVDNLIYTYGGRTLEEVLIEPNDEPQYCESFNGNIVLIPKHVYTKVGMNNPIYRHALGDFDYGLRATKLDIKSVIAPGVCGKCDKHDKLPKWCNPDTTFKERIIELYKPLGCNPFEHFVFDNRHSGFMIALKHFLSIHLRVLIPKLWIK